MGNKENISTLEDSHDLKIVGRASNTPMTTVVTHRHLLRNRLAIITEMKFIKLTNLPAWAN